jgi:hypothetical protein
VKARETPKKKRILSVPDGVNCGVIQGGSGKNSCYEDGDMCEICFGAGKSPD